MTGEYILSGLEKPSLSELEHYGVKGMRWGKRKGGLAGKVKAHRARQKAANREVGRIGKMIAKDIAKGIKSDIRAVKKDSEKFAKAHLALTKYAGQTLAITGASAALGLATMNIAIKTIR